MGPGRVPEIPWLAIVKLHGEVAALVLVGADLAVGQFEEDALFLERPLLIGETEAFKGDLGECGNRFHKENDNGFPGYNRDPMPEMSVVIPTLNEERTIESCLRAVGRRQGVEVVVSDGGSGDQTVRRARSLGAVVVEGRPGRGGQLNRGAAATRAEWLLFLHADCRLPKDWNDAVATALADPATALACFRLRTEPASGSQPSAARRMWLRTLDLRSRGLRLPYGDQGFAVRRHVFESLGGFPDIPLMEDLEFARSCRRVGTIRRLPLEIRTTARRTDAFPVRARVMMLVFPVLFRLGVPPATLARWYGIAR